MIQKAISLAKRKAAIQYSLVRPPVITKTAFKRRVHGQLYGLTGLPVLIATKVDATTSSPLLEKKINILLM